MRDGASLSAAYFDGIFAGDDDPWNLASSDYEAAKFDHTRSVLADRRYANGFEVGCAHGILTERIVDLCDRLLAIDISRHAVARAQRRLAGRRHLDIEMMAFPGEAPAEAGFELVVLSEVIYYWNAQDLARAGDWLRSKVVTGGRVILVHYTGATDYPHSADVAVETLWAGLADDFIIQRAEREARYRLDLWERR